MKKINKQIIKFFLVGSSTVLIDFFVYYLLINLSIPGQTSKFISFICGALYSFAFNTKWTFYSGYSYNKFIKFFLIYLLSLLINSFLYYVIVNYLFFSISNPFLVILPTIASATFNFLGLKLYVFKYKK